jgi:hypothetical protein
MDVLGKAKHLVFSRSQKWKYPAKASEGNYDRVLEM